MKKFLFSLLTIFIPLFGITQTLDIGPPDTSICDGVAIDIIATTNVGGGGMTVPVQVVLSDDQYSGVIPMTFDFAYYGNIYNQLVISSNSYVTFDLTQAGGGSAWGINTASPNAATTNNRIMFPWQDTNPDTGGIISYMVCGEAPNRVFIVDYFEVGMFSCAGITFTNQLKLFETSNRIEMHITNKPLCATWNGGAAIQGLENINGTVGHIVPGRNFPTQWVTVNDAYEFVPDGLGGYVINPIAFDPAPLQNTQINWYANSLLSPPIAIDVTQINVAPMVDTWYYCEAILPCGVGFSLVDSILVYVGSTTATSIEIDPSCFGFTNGLIEIDATVTTHFPVEYDVQDDAFVTIQNIQTNDNVDTVFGLGVGTYHIDIINDIGCSTTLDVILGEPDLLVANGDHGDISCFGDNNGIAYVYPYGGTDPYTYQWNDPLNQITEHIDFLPPGPVQVTITDANGCVLDTTMMIVEPLPLSFDVTSWEDTCYRSNGQILIEINGGTGPFDYFWWSAINPNNYYVDHVDNYNLVTGLPNGTYEIMVSDFNGCSVDIVTDVILINPPQADFLTRSKPTEIINPDVLFDNESHNAVTYEWLFGDNTNSYEENPWHTYDDAGTYLVELIAYSEPEFGCSDTAFGYVTVDPLYTFYVPSSFTPDGDGLNDMWGPKGQFFEEESYNLKVYDRWGKIMFNTDNPNQFWNGRYLNTGNQVKIGTYVYIFELKKFNTFEPKTIDGIVTISRNN